MGGDGGLLPARSAAMPFTAFPRRDAGKGPQCSVSIVVVMLVPTMVLLVVVALVAWLMVYQTAFEAVEEVANEGQACFVQATR